MAQSPCAFTWSCRPFTSALIFGSGDRTAYGNTSSSGSTSSRQNSSTQSSFFWNCGSVEKSHAIGCTPCSTFAASLPRRKVRMSGTDVPVPLLHHELHLLPHPSAGTGSVVWPQRRHYVGVRVHRVHANSTRSPLRHACHLRSRRVLFGRRRVKWFVDDEQFGCFDGAGHRVEDLGCALDDVLQRRGPHRAGD